LRHRRMVAPINSIKHYVQLENAQIASGAVRQSVLVDAVGQNLVAAVEDVVEGSLVKAIFIEHWVKSFAAAGEDTKFQLVIEKVPAGQTPVTFTQMNNLMTYPNKKNVFFYSQGVIGDLTTQSIPVVRNWFLIPKGKQRMGLGDKIVETVSATAAVIQNCGFSTYKEYK